MMLCIDHGTYPFVTSSTPSSASVPVGAGISPKWIDNVVGVAKAYCTRVGEYPFPTELHDEIAHEIRERGHEYKTVTGRPRRVGWFDAVVARYTSRLAGIDNWALMLFGRAFRPRQSENLHSLRTRRENYRHSPSTISKLARCKPVFIEMEGWKEDITAIKTFDELPEAAKAYVRKIEELTNVPVGVISAGPRPHTDSNHLRKTEEFLRLLIPNY